MGLTVDDALVYVRTSTSIPCIVYFDVVLDLREDLDRVAEEAESLGWIPDVNWARLSVRLFRPRPRPQDQG